MNTTGMGIGQGAAEQKPAFIEWRRLRRCPQPPFGYAVLNVRKETACRIEVGKGFLPALRQEVLFARQAACPPVPQL